MKGFGLVLERLPSGAVCLLLRGELDFEHAYTFDEELQGIERARPPCIVLDLRQLSFVDSCGMGRLLAARRRALRAKRRLLLIRGGQAIDRLLALTRLEDEFEIVRDLPSELMLEPSPRV